MDSLSEHLCNAMYVQVLKQENRVIEAKSNGWEIRVTCLFYLSGALHKNTHYHTLTNFCIMKAINPKVIIAVIITAVILAEINS